jgi:hypothetical protein
MIVSRSRRPAQQMKRGPRRNSPGGYGICCKQLLMKTPVYRHLMSWRFKDVFFRVPLTLSLSVDRIVCSAGRSRSRFASACETPIASDIC